MATCINKPHHTPPHPAPVSLPATGFVRLKQLVGDPKASPPVPPLIPIGAASIWRRVKNKTFPQPIKLGPQTTVWRVEDVRAWIKAQAERIPS